MVSHGTLSSTTDVAPLFFCQNPVAWGDTLSDPRCRACRLKTKQTTEVVVSNTFLFLLRGDQLFSCSHACSGSRKKARLLTNLSILPQVGVSKQIKYGQKVYYFPALLFGGNCSAVIDVCLAVSEGLA